MVAFIPFAVWQPPEPDVNTALAGSEGKYYFPSEPNAKERKNHPSFVVKTTEFSVTFIWHQIIQAQIEHVLPINSGEEA